MKIRIIGIICVIIAIILTICFLIQPLEVEYTEDIIIDAEIISVSHKIPRYYYFIYKDTDVDLELLGKHLVTLRYENIEKTYDDYILYNFCKDKVGSTTKCLLSIQHYTGGRTSQCLRAYKGEW